MGAWWQELSGLNRFFFGGAILFTLPFLWQLAAAFIGLDADSDLDGDTGDGVATDADATVLAFKLLSVRALLAFFVLFFWSAALHLNRGTPLGRALGFSMIWGLAGLVCVGLLLYLLPKLSHSGNRNLESAVGGEATVYLDIPAGGVGEVRALVDGTLTHLKARATGDCAIKAGTRVRIARRVGQSLVEVRSE